VSVTRVVVIGGGITGLTAGFRLAEEARRSRLALDLTVLESAAHAGGHATTMRDDGFLVEAGPNGFLDRPREPQVTELARALGIGARLIEARPAARKRFVLLRGRLRRAPDSPPTLLQSDVLSPLGKLRLMLEPLARAARNGAEESVFDFARRRIGREAAEVLVDAAVAGISAGDSRRLSVAHAFPLMIEMEREHGSLVRAMIARRKEGKSRLMSFEGGMATLIEALVARLGPALRCDAAVRSLTRAGAEWRIALESGGTLSTDCVLLALPAARAATIVRGLDPAFADALAAFPFAGIVMTALAYGSADIGPLDGYGYLVARSEKLDTLGVLWESSVFDGRAPQGMALLRVMMGGVRGPAIADLAEAELVTRARAELERVMGIRAKPRRVWVRRWPRAIAQYELGHGQRVALARAQAARHPGLDLCGTSYDGVSFGSAVKSAEAAARRMIAVIAGAAGGATLSAANAAGDAGRGASPSASAREPALGRAGGSA
jgi:protoporphyrinogen/coproporphyrinogen III oxidase